MAEWLCERQRGSYSFWPIYLSCVAFEREWLNTLWLVSVHVVDKKDQVKLAILDNTAEDVTHFVLPERYIEVHRLGGPKQHD